MSVEPTKNKDGLDTDPLFANNKNGYGHQTGITFRAPGLSVSTAVIARNDFYGYYVRAVC